MFNGRVTRSQAKQHDINISTGYLEPRKRKRKLPSAYDAPNSKRSKVEIAASVKPESSGSPKMSLTNVNQMAMPSTHDEPNSKTSKVESAAMVKPESSGSSIALATNLMQVAVIDFKLEDIVWAKIKGYPPWPAKIVLFPTAKTAMLLWFNDYRKTKVFRTQLFKFLPNFDKFAVHFKKHLGLETAAKEALQCYGQNMFK